jgi:hypothetical protein
MQYMIHNTIKIILFRYFMSYIHKKNYVMYIFYIFLLLKFQGKIKFTWCKNNVLLQKKTRVSLYIEQVTTFPFLVDKT